MDADVKRYEAIVMDTGAVDDLIEAGLNVNGEATRRGDSLTYRVRCRNKEDLEAFQAQIGDKAAHWPDSSDVPEETAKELLEKQLGTKICRMIVDGDDQIILIDDKGGDNKHGTK